MKFRWFILILHAGARGGELTSVHRFIFQYGGGSTGSEYLRRRVALVSYTFPLNLFLISSSLARRSFSLVSRIQSSWY
jgi:hypothetical protein